MANKRRRQIPSVEESLYSKPYEYEFHQAVKLLELINTNATPLGEDVSPGKEPVSIKSRISLSVPASDIYSLDAQDTATPPVMSVNFWGIAGLQGPLPTSYTEQIIDRIYKKDKSLRDFLDIFNHRLISILHRIRKKYWVGLSITRPPATDIGQCLLSLIGLKDQQLAQSINIPTHSLLYYSGLFWQQPRSAAGLQAILSHYFNVSVKVAVLQGRWLYFEESQTTHIGLTGQFQVLGQGAVIGTKVWDNKTLCTLRIGPLGEDMFRQFLKTGSAYPTLLKLAQFYLPQEQKFNTNLIIKAKDVQSTHLDSKSQLGWTSWLKVKEFKDDDAQVRIFPSV